MAELKTKPSDQDVEVFFEAILDAGRREDCRAVARLMQRLTGASPILWGGNILGFGAYRYRYASGREGDWFQTGLAARKQDMSLYLMGGLAQQSDLLARLGKYKIGKGCLYLKRLADVDAKVLEELIQTSIRSLPGSNGSPDRPAAWGHVSLQGQDHSPGGC